MGDGRSVDEAPRVGMQVPALTPIPLVLATALSNPLAESNGVDFIDTLDYDFIGLPKASAIHNFLKRAAADPEFEQWLMYEIGQTYHHSAHRGLSGATPYSAWSTLSEASKPRLLPDSAAEELCFLIHFLPIARRTIQADGLMLFYLHYWHPIFAAWRAANRRVVVRYHPEDLSKVFVSADGKEYVEASFADLRRDRISLWEQKAALKHLRSQGKSHVTESAIFNAIAAQRSLIEGATTKRRSADRRGRAGETSPFPASGRSSEETKSPDASSSTPDVD